MPRLATRAEVAEEAIRMLEAFAVGMRPTDMNQFRSEVRHLANRAGVKLKNEL